MSDKPQSNDPAPNDARRLPAIVPEAVEVIRPSARLMRRDADNGKAPSIDARLVLHAIARWWKVALPAGLLIAACAGGGAYYMHVPRYLAAAYLYIQADEPFVAFKNGGDSQRFIDTQLDLIRSPVILQDVLFQPQIAKLPEIQLARDRVAWVSANLRVTAARGSDLVRIEMTGSDPDGVATIVNAIAAEYVGQHRQSDRSSTNNLIKLLAEEQRKRMAELQRLQDEARALAKDATGDETVLLGDGPNAIAFSTRLAAFQSNLANVESELELLKAKLGALQAEYEANPLEFSDEELQGEIDAHPMIVGLGEELDRAQAALEATRSKAAANFTARTEREQVEVETIQARIEDARASLREETAAKVRQHFQQQRDGAIAEMKAQIADLRVQEEFHRKRLDAEREEAKKRGSHTLDLEFKLSEMKRAEEVYQRIAGRVTELSTEQYAPSRVEIKREAEPAADPVNSRAKMVGLAALAGLGFPFCLALLWEIKVRRISTADQMEALSQVPLLGEVPQLPAQSLLPGRRARERFERQRATFEESIASLRTCLVLSDDEQRLQVIAVASAVSREGKTSIAAQLASSLANSVAEPVLLVDADLRDPDIHELFDVPLAPGLAPVLAQQCNVHDAIVGAKTSQLRLLPAGRLQQNPHSLFGGSAFTDVIAELRKQYRYIIVDCPPLLSASEALVVAKVADGAILCTMRDHSRSVQLMQAKHRLSMAGIKFLGAVLNGVPSESYASRYGGYYDSRYVKK